MARGARQQALDPSTNSHPVSPNNTAARPIVTKTTLAPAQASVFADTHFGSRTMS